MQQNTAGTSGNTDRIWLYTVSVWGVGSATAHDESQVRTAAPRILLSGSAPAVVGVALPVVIDDAL
jgi:hypothetical protein